MGKVRVWRVVGGESRRPGQDGGASLESVFRPRHLGPRTPSESSRRLDNPGVSPWAPPLPPRPSHTVHRPGSGDLLSTRGHLSKARLRAGSERRPGRDNSFQDVCTWGPRGARWAVCGLPRWRRQGGNSVLGKDFCTTGATQPRPRPKAYQSAGKCRSAGKGGARTSLRGSLVV